MAWRHLVITQPSKLSYKNNQLLIQINADTQQLPLSDIHTIVVSTTRAVVTTYLLQKIIENNIKIIFCDQNHDPCAELDGFYQNVNRNQNIQKQFEWSQESKDILWDAIVRAKLIGEAIHFKSVNGEADDLVNEVNKIEFADTSNREAVVAKKYFVGLFGKDFTRQQDNDINAALNYGYSILLSCFNREVVGQGYLTQLGIHHSSVKNDFNLSSDLMEPFRPFVDRIVKKYENVEFSELVKYELIDVLNQEVVYDGKKMYLENLISVFVRESVGFLNGSSEMPKFLESQNAG